MGFGDRGGGRGGRGTPTTRCVSSLGGWVLGSANRTYLVRRDIAPLAYALLTYKVVKFQSGVYRLLKYGILKYGTAPSCTTGIGIRSSCKMLTCDPVLSMGLVDQHQIQAPVQALHWLIRPTHSVPVV
jgi:hypothetical protein